MRSRYKLCHKHLLDCRVLRAPDGDYIGFRAQIGYLYPDTTDLEFWPHTKDSWAAVRSPTWPRYRGYEAGWPGARPMTLIQLSNVHPDDLQAIREVAITPEKHAMDRGTILSRFSMMLHVRAFKIEQMIKAGRWPQHRALSPLRRRATV